MEKCRCTFIMPSDEWQIFKMVASRQKVFDDNGKLRQGSASLILREAIHEYLSENQKILAELLQEAREHNVKNTIVSTLKEMVEEEET